MKPKIKSNAKNSSTSLYVNQILSFLQNYQIENIDERTMVIRTMNINKANEKSQILEFLIKNTTVQINQIKDIEKILSTHLSFSKDYLLCLIDYQVTNDLPSNETNMSFSNIQAEPKQIIKAVYQYSSKSLFSDFQIRQNQNYFYQQNDLWKIITVLVHGLNYLEENGVIYGVLGFQRIHFLSSSDGQEWKIKLLDPSATAMDPLQIKPDRHYSPQLLFKYLCSNQIRGSENQRQSLIESQTKTITIENQELDMFKSDVYVMGLLILQLGLLQQIKPITKFQDPCSSTQTSDENYFFYYKDHFKKIRLFLQKFAELYSKQLTNLVSVLLAENPFDRPNFPELLQYLLNLQQQIPAISEAIIKNSNRTISIPLQIDAQDRPSSQANEFQQNLEVQEPDKMKEEDSIIVGRVQQQAYPIKSAKSDFQRALQTFNLTNKKLRFGSKNCQKLQNNSSINDHIYQSAGKANKKNSAKKDQNQQYYKTSHTRTHSRNGSSSSYQDKNAQQLNFSNKRMIKKSRKISNQSQQQIIKTYRLEKVEENILDLQQQEELLDKQSFKQVLNQLNYQGANHKQIKHPLVNSNLGLIDSSNNHKNKHEVSELRKTLQLNKIVSEEEEQHFLHQETKAKNKNKAKIIKQKVIEAISKELPLIQSKSRSRNQSNHSQSSKEEYLSAYSRNSQNTNSMNQSKSNYRYKQQEVQEQYYIKPYTNSEKFEKCNGLFTDPKLLREIRQERSKVILPGSTKYINQNQQAKHLLFR